MELHQYPSSTNATSATDAPPYVSECEKNLERDSQDPMFSGAHLRDLVDYLKISIIEQPPQSPLYEAPPFAWSYELGPDGGLLLTHTNKSKDFDVNLADTHATDPPKLLFLTGHPSPAWLNAVGYKYEVDPHFFQRHMSYLPSVQVDTYTEPSLPSNSRQILKLNIPTIGYIDPSPLESDEDIQSTRATLTNSLRKTFRDRSRAPIAGSSIVRILHMHDWRRFTLVQEVSMCLLGDKDKWTVLIWTDAGGEDCDPNLPFADLPGYERFSKEAKLCPVTLHRPSTSYQYSTPTSSYKTTQTFNLLHRSYGRTLDPLYIALHPFYAVSEIYSLAAASENQFLNMMERILSERIERITSTSNALPEAADLQYDRNILDAHRDQIRSTVSFLTAHDDPTWFLLSQTRPQHPENEVTRAARQILERDFLHLQNRVTQQILRCERAMDMITDKASLAEAQRSNSQSEGLAKLTRLTTLVTILYVPASFVCTFFGMNFKVFGQGELGIWIWGAVSAPVLVLSVFFLYR